MMHIILLSKNDLDAISKALRRMEPLTLTRALGDTEITVHVKEARNPWTVAMVVQVKVKQGRLEWAQTFESAEKAVEIIGKL